MNASPARTRSGLAVKTGTYKPSNVRGVVVANCGHFVPEEQPQELVKLIQTAVTDRLLQLAV